MVKKIFFYVLIIFITWLLAFFLHDIGIYLYKKNNSFERDLSWGIFVHFIFNYLYPMGLILSIFLFFWKKKMVVAIIPYLILILYIWIEGWIYRPFRTILILGSISVGYFLLFVGFRISKKYKIGK